MASVSVLILITYIGKLLVFYYNFFCIVLCELNTNVMLNMHPDKVIFKQKQSMTISAQDYNTDYINASSSIDRLKYVCTRKNVFTFL